MDGIGSLDLAWAQGYDGSQAEFITRDVICFKCGNKVKFVGVDGQESMFPSPPEGLGVIAVQGLGHTFAFSDQVIDPTIHVYQYPSFRLVSQLKGGAKLEYTKIVFSSSEFLATLSGVPDFELTLWNFNTGDKLATHDFGNLAVSSLSFNPANWRQLCAASEKEVSLWQIERSNNLFLFHKQKLRLPVVDGSGMDDERDVLTRASTRMSRVTINLPQTCVAGVKGREADSFEDYQDEVQRVVPTSHVWTPSGDVFMGCAGGQLIKIDGESGGLSLLYNPGRRAVSAVSRTSNSIIREQSELELGESSTSIGISSTITEGSMTCLALHKKGLFIGGQDGTLRQLEITPNQVRLVESHPLGVPITSLNFNPNHHRLAIGGIGGCMHLYDADSESPSISSLFDVHYGNFVAVECLPVGSDHCVSVRVDGELQVWQLDSAKLIGSTSLGQEVLSMAASPLMNIVVVGTSNGDMFFVDVNKVTEPRIVHRVHIHKGPIYQIVFNQNGRLLLSGSDDGHVFVLDGRPSKTFTPLGHVSLEGRINTITTHLNEQSQTTKVVVTSSTNSDPRVGATRVMHFDLAHDVNLSPSLRHASLKGDFASDKIGRLTFNFASPSYGGAAAEGDMVYTLCQNTKNVHKIQLPNEPPKKEFSKDSYLKPVVEVPAHQLPGGMVKISPHQKWLASCGGDGRLSVRAVGAMDRSIEVNAHDFRTEGVNSFAFSADACRLLTTGFDGTLACYKWNFSNPAKAKSAVESARSRQMTLMKEGQNEDEILMKMKEWSPSHSSRPGSSTEKADKEKSEKEQAIEAALDNDAIYNTPTPVPGEDATWLEAKELDALKEEDKQYSEVKKDLRLQIRDMRRKLQTMMKSNEAVPDIEKLGHHDFDLDTEEQTRLEAEGEAEVRRIREEKEFDNLAKMYLADLIKRECWDEMLVKGRALLAFNSTMEVQNYPMKNRTQPEKDELESVKLRRKIEIDECKARKELVESPQKAPAKILDEDLDGDDEGMGRDKAAAAGSLDYPSGQYGGGSELFYSQFDLHGREQKMSQIVLLQDAIYRIKMLFDKEFDSVYEKKEQELGKIQDKNRRIRKILEELGLPQDQVFEPKMGVEEKPELLLTVSDDEVKVEQFLTPEQRKKQEEEQKAEELRRQAEKSDNWRERGLDLMMGGVLEIKKEDELKKDILMPVFMTAKEEDKWTEDEKKAAQDYERRVKELQEEREKYRKQLELELKKLETMTQESTQTFDDALTQLFIRKIKTEMVIYQEELKIQRMKYALLLEEELDNREGQLIDLLEHKKKLKSLATQAMVESKKNMEDFHEEYRNLEVEERLLDKNFKKEFNDVPALLADQLYKLFRRRPRGQRARGAETPIHDPNSLNPFADRPSTARKSDDQRRAVESALSELDKDSNAPEGCDIEIWLRLCQYRREKVSNEQLLKQKAQTLADMEEFWKKRQTEDDGLRGEIEELVDAISKLKEDRLRFTCNLEVQLLLKQGQVEVDAGNFIHDYRGSLLIHRVVVEELNGKIRQLGQVKISTMVESKDFRKGIVQLEWEHKKMTMKMEDLQNKMRDIQNLKVTREIQSFLNETDYDGKKAQEIATLEQTIQLMKKHHEKNLAEKKKIIKELMRVINDKHEENQALTEELEELNVSVNERRLIHQVNADKRSDEGRADRYRQIVQRRKLVDLAKAQAQEVAVLRAEVERLRMRTFPALVQVEH